MIKLTKKERLAIYKQLLEVIKLLKKGKAIYMCDSLAQITNRLIFHEREITTQWVIRNYFPEFNLFDPKGDKNLEKYTNGPWFPTYPGFSDQPSRFLKSCHNHQRTIIELCIAMLE